jgi:hypothetical protein
MPQVSDLERQLQSELDLPRRAADVAGGDHTGGRIHRAGRAENVVLRIAEVFVIENVKELGAELELELLLNNS